MSNTDQKGFYQRTDITGEPYEPMQAPRFTEVATFMRTPLVESLDGVDIGIIGIPYDGGLTCRTGARYGPREVRDESTLMRAINVATGEQPYDRARVADLGDVRFNDLFNLEKAQGKQQVQGLIIFIFQQILKLVISIQMERLLSRKISL